MITLKDLAVYYTAQMRYGNLVTYGCEMTREPVDGGYVLRFTALEAVFFVDQPELDDFQVHFNAMPYLAQSALRVHASDMLRLAHAHTPGTVKPDWWREDGRYRHGQFRERYSVVDMMGLGR